LSGGPDVFAIEVSTDQQYRDALYDPSITTITITQPGITVTPHEPSTNWSNPGDQPRPAFILEGQVVNGQVPVISSNRSAFGGALDSILTFNGYDYATPVDSIRNLAFSGFSATGMQPNAASGSAASVLHLYGVQNGLHNLHFRNNYSTEDMLALYDSKGGIHGLTAVDNIAADDSVVIVRNLSGGIHNARFINNLAMQDAVLLVEDLLNGGLNDSVFIGNRVQRSSDSAAGATASFEGNVELTNNTFLVNTSSQNNAQNPVHNGAAVTHTTLPNNNSGVNAVTIAASANQRTLFYGNTRNTGSGPNPSALHFDSWEDKRPSESWSAQAGNPTTVNVTMNAGSSGKILMLDPLSSQADDLPDFSAGGNEPYDIKPSNLTVNLIKTGAGDWFLGGASNLPGASTWNIDTGTLALTTVDYGAGIGVQQAAVNLGHANSVFNLNTGGTLAGHGTIQANTIQLNGTLRPAAWGNVGTKANDIRNDISDAAIAAIDVAQTSEFGTLSFNGDVTMTGAKYYADISPGGNDKLDITGSLTLAGSGNELFIRPRSDQAVSNVAVISASSGITGNFDPANVFVTTPAFLNMTATASKVGNNIEVSTGSVSLVWDENDTSAANGTFDLDPVAGISTFSVTTALTGAGKPLTKTGDGTLFLNGVNTYTGDTTVTAGTLRVGETAGSNASVASKVTVAPGAVIGGHGTLAGGLVLSNGAIVSPGASIGDLTVIGNVGTPGAIYEFDINPDGTADHLIVNGNIDITGSELKIVHGGGSGTFGLSTTYAGIIQASGGVTGTFNTITNTLPLLDAAPAYLPNAVDLTMTRNSVTFASIGTSGNQVNVGQALDALGSHAVANAVAQLDATGIRAAMDNLSGELYASTRSALLGNRYLQNAVNQRLRSAAGQPLWVSTWGYNGHLSGNANAAKVDTRGLGLALGGDWQVGSNLTVGVVLGYEDGRIKSANRSSTRSNVDAYSAGAYLAGSAGGIDLRGGVAVSYLDVDTRRDITVPGLQGVVKSDYKGHKTQVFAEVSKTFEVDSLSVAPYLGLSQNWLHTRAANERGNAAALDVAAQTDHVLQSTLGLRLAYQLPSAPVALTADLAWTRSSGHTDSHSTHRFAGQGARFGVQGVDVAKNTAQVGAGVQAQLSQNAALSVGYQGQFGSNTRNHSAGVQIRVKF